MREARLKHLASYMLEEFPDEDFTQMLVQIMQEEGVLDVHESQ